MELWNQVKWQSKKEQAAKAVKLAKIAHREFLGFAAPLLSLVALGPGPPPKQQDGVQHRKVLFDFFVAFLFVVVVALAFSKEFAAAHMISHDIHPAPAWKKATIKTLVHTYYCCYVYLLYVYWWIAYLSNLQL